MPNLTFRSKEEAKRVGALAERIADAVIGAPGKGENRILCTHKPPVDAANSLSDFVSTGEAAVWRTLDRDELIMIILGAV